MTKSEIAKAESNKYLDTLNNGSEQMVALRANMLPGEKIELPDLLRIPCPTGGATSWAWEENGKDQTAPAIEGILVGYRARGILWPYEEPGDTPPLLVSDDLVVAYKVGDDYGDLDPESIEDHRMPDGMYRWRSLPQNEWGSGKGGSGKRCKEQRLLFVLRAGDLWPCLVIIPPGSLRDVTRSIKMLKVPHWRAVVSLSLSKEKNKAGQPFSQIHLSCVDTLDEVAGEKVKRLYTDTFSNPEASATEYTD